MSTISETICGLGVKNLISPFCFKTGYLGRMQNNKFNENFCINDTRFLTKNGRTNKENIIYI